MTKNTVGTYQELKNTHTATYQKLRKHHNMITGLRLLIALIFLLALYQYYHTAASVFLFLLIAVFVSFIVLMNKNQKISWKKRFYQNLIRINKDELKYLQKEGIPFEDGMEFQDPHHAYAMDLDLFGDRSLFHHINRTATYQGKATLAYMLLTRFPEQQIRDNQLSIAELAPALSFRQDIHALASITEDSKERYQKLLQWSKSEEQNIGIALKLISWILPAALLLSLGIYWLTGVTIYWDVALRIFPLNLVVLAAQLKHIRKALFGADRVNEMLKQYASILKLMEAYSFTSKGMQQLQARLKTTDKNASQHIQRLSRICANLESIQNPFGSVLLNGLFLYHIHAWHTLIVWKKKHAHLIPEWMAVMGELEALCSVANLSYNNPDFVFPELNRDGKISFTDLGHPLIREEQRVCNSVSFVDHRFIILTGSNMSGKSTFLRTLGVNMVLAGMGAVVCASSAHIQPLSIFVSMRQSDSLADSESYFFAEVKRLKFIIDQLEEYPCFVLLDEILRGTNSDDKRSGTIGVIEKIINRKAIGAIATHDLEVCLTTDVHPDILINKCFEVEIINNDLHFDYKLRDGICKNKSATFLMKKMDII